jgi:sugar phosphate isomerase/epimerase
MSFSAVDAHTSLLVPEIGVPHITKAMDAAAELGCRIVVTDEGPVSPYWTSPDTAFDVFRTSLDHVLEHGRRRGVLLAVEPHNPLTVSEKYTTVLLESYPPEALGINFDTGNVYLAGRDPCGMLEKLLPRVVHIHGKDIPAAMAAKRGHATGTRVGTAIGSGVVDFRGLLALLKRKSYSGILSVECDTLAEARRSREYLESFDGDEKS